VIFAGESKTRLDRKDFSDDYKANRVSSEDVKFKEFRTGLAELLKFLGWDIISVNGAEADDVIASIVAKYCHRCKCKVPCGDDCTCALKYKTDVVIFSGDRDLQQCLAWDRTFIYRAPGLILTKTDVEEDLGFPIDKLNIYKALIGDKSDNIKGVEGFGPARATMAIKANSVAEDIWEMRGHEGAEEFRLALDLVNLNYRVEVDLDSLYLGPPIFEDASFKKNYEEKILLEVKRLKEEF
jgi:DNA polymerase-1